MWNMASSFTAKWALKLVLMGFWVLLTGKKTLEIDSSQALLRIDSYLRQAGTTAAIDSIDIDSS